MANPNVPGKDVTSLTFNIFVEFDRRRDIAENVPLRSVTRDLHCKINSHIHSLLLLRSLHSKYCFCFAAPTNWRDC